MKKKLFKAALLSVAAITLVVATVFVTVAYITSKASISNTFTVGNVSLELYESKVNDDGQKLADNPNVNGSKKDAIGNIYHLVPGKTYDKDPTVYINSTSSQDEAYLFVYVQNGIKDIELGHYNHGSNVPQDEIQAIGAKITIEEQMKANGWVKLEDGTKGTVYYYATNTGTSEAPVYTMKAVGGDTGINQVDIFSQFHIDGHAVVNAYKDAQINILAFAIQTTGFDTPSAAWTALKAAYPAETLNNGN